MVYFKFTYLFFFLDIIFFLRYYRKLIYIFFQHFLNIKNLNPQSKTYISFEIWLGKFLCKNIQVEASTRSSKMAKNAIFVKITIFKWLYLCNSCIKLNSVTSILKIMSKPLKIRSHVHRVAFQFLAYVLVRPALTIPCCVWAVRKRRGG